MPASEKTQHLIYLIIYGVLKIKYWLYKEILSRGIHFGLFVTQDTGTEWGFHKTKLQSPHCQLVVSSGFEKAPWGRAGGPPSSQVRTTDISS